MKLNEKTLPYLTMAISVVFVTLILLLSTGITGDTDSIAHYMFSRYAFKYPELFLEHWGKPLFTILSAPFAQLGYTGAMIFNILCGLLTAWLIYRIASKLLYDYSWTVILMVIFSPVYLINMFTSLTEILFSLVLVGAIYLFLVRRFIGSAILISLIPFARTEGLMFLPLFLVAYLWMKQYRAIPFLAAGFVLFGLLGLPKYQDFWWFFTAMPYGESGSELYGSGSFFFYVRKFHHIMGFPLIILALVGTGAIAKWFISSRKLLHDIGWTTEYVLILPAFFGFILAHSFLWWQGLMGVLASYRFIACVLPLGAFIALAGFNVIINSVSYNRVVRNRVGALIILSVLVTPFVYYKIPFIPRGSYDTIEKAATWLRNSAYHDRFIYYFDPTVAFFLKEDPWDEERVFQIKPDRENPEKSFNDSAVVFWENSFGAFEAGIPFEKLLLNPHFKLLNVFVPKKDFTSASGEFYFLALFEKTLPDSVRKQFETFRMLDFEDTIPGDREQYRTDSLWVSPSHGYHLKGESYSHGFEFMVNDLPPGETVFMRISCKMNLPEGFPRGKMILVLEIRDENDRIYRYLATNDGNFAYTNNEWFEMSILTSMNKIGTGNGIMRVYAWNQAGTGGFLDNLKIEYFPIQE